MIYEIVNAVTDVISVFDSIGLTKPVEVAVDSLALPSSDEEYYHYPMVMQDNLANNSQITLLAFFAVPFIMFWIIFILGPITLVSVAITWIVMLLVFLLAEAPFGLY